MKLILFVLLLIIILLLVRNKSGGKIYDECFKKCESENPQTCIDKCLLEERDAYTDIPIFVKKKKMV